jgi:hypothetical protein
MADGDLEAALSMYKEDLEWQKQHRDKFPGTGRSVHAGILYLLQSFLCAGLCLQLLLRRKCVRRYAVSVELLSAMSLDLLSMLACCRMLQRRHV